MSLIHASVGDVFWAVVALCWLWSSVSAGLLCRRTCVPRDHCVGVTKVWARPQLPAALMVTQQGRPTQVGGGGLGSARCSHMQQPWQRQPQRWSSYRQF